MFSNSRTQLSHPSLPKRLLALLLAVSMASLGCPPAAAGGEPTPGRRDHQRAAEVSLRYGSVNAMTGNLLVPRVDLSIDTLIGTLEVGAVFNSATQAWIWSFDESYDNDAFTDATGAVHTGLSAWAEGDALGGTTWVKSKQLRIKSKAGLVRHFHGDSRRLRWMYWGDVGESAFPRLDFSEQTIAGAVRITQVRQCISSSECRDVISISYDADGHVVAIEDVAGRRAEFTWSGSALVNARDGLDVAEGRPGFEYEYGLFGHLTAITNGEGERTEIAYTAGQVVEVKDIGEGDPTHSFVYEDEIDGLYATRYWDPLGNEHVYTFDTRHRLHAIENRALGERTAWGYAASLRPIAMTDSTGATRLYSWSGDDLTREIQPSGNIVRYSYAPTGIGQPTEATRLFDRNLANPGHRPLLRVEDSLGLVEERSYDSSGRLISVSNGSGDTISFGYWQGTSRPRIPGSSQIRNITLPTGDVISRSHYGWHGHASHVTRRSHFFPDQVRLFDLVGNRLEGAEAGSPEEGGVLGRSYDADRNVREIFLEGGESIAIDIRSDGQLTGVERPGGDDHLMSYDALGRLEARSEWVDGQWYATTGEYDPMGRLTALERPNGMRRQFQYDAAGRVKTASNLRSGATESMAVMSYSGGHRVSTYDSVRGGTELYLYDAAGRVTAVGHAGGSKTTFGYDLRSRTTDKAYWAGSSLVRSLGYTYDLANRETEVWDGVTQILRRSFQNGLLSEADYGNGLTRAFSYSGSGRLTGTETVAADGTLVESTTVTRSFVWGSDPTVRATTTTSAGVDATTTDSYTLTSSVDPGPGYGAYTLGGLHNQRLVSWEDALQTVPLSYDGKSNLLSEGTTTFSYNTEGNRLLSANLSGALPIQYTYDEAGYTTSRDGKPITWTAHGRMASHGSDSFEWDALRAPVRSTVDGSTQTWLFGGAVLGDAEGNPTRIGVDEYEIDLQSNSRLYRHFDFRNNVKFTTSESGTAQAHYAYSAYGVEEVHGSTEDKIRFTGNMEVGDLAQLGDRTYDSASGRFLSIDPVFQNINLYGYTLGNPVAWWDPNGRTWQGLIFAIRFGLNRPMLIALGLAGVTDAGGHGTACAVACAGVAIFDGILNASTASQQGGPRAPW